MDNPEDLIELKNGNQLAFSKLIDRYSSMVFNLTFNLVKNQEEVEDLTQEIFTTVFLSMHQFNGDSKLSTWIYRITVNKCKEHIRSKSRKKRFGFLTTLDKAEGGTKLHADFNHPGIKLENKELSVILFSAINQLPEKQRIAFTMHKIEGIPYEEIAGAMKTSLSSVESLIFRARKNLKELLGSYYEKNAH